MSKNQSTAVAVIPDGFGEIGPVTLPEASKTPYIQFVSSKSKNYGEVYSAIKTIREGEPVLIQPEKDPIKLNPLKYFLLHASEYWGNFNQLGELVSMSYEKPEAVAKGPYFAQVIETAVLVVLEDRLVPAQCRFKATKCPAVYPAISALAEANTAAWGHKGADYAFTLKIDKPWARFTTTSTRTERTNREKGTTYPTMEKGVINPTSAADLTKLVAFFQDADAVAVLHEVASGYKRRLAEAAKKELVPA